MNLTSETLSSEIDRVYKAIADGTPGFVEQEAARLLKALDEAEVTANDAQALNFHAEALDEALAALRSFPLGRYKSEWANNIKYLLAQMSAYWGRRSLQATKAYRHAVGSLVVHKATGRHGKIIEAHRSRAANGRALYTVRFFDDTGEMKTFYANELQKT